jgi:predicted nucleic acid-binding protein
VRVYVESNFLVELTLEQEQHQSCDDILSICKRDRIPLLLPAFSVPEARYALEGKRKRRRQLGQNFTIELNDFMRSGLFRAHEAELISVKKLLASSSDDEDRQFEICLGRVLSVVEIIALDHQILSSALSIKKSGAPKELFDSIVLASVLADLDRSEPMESCFLNKDSGDFDDPDIVDMLERRNCKILFSFDDAKGYLTGKKI